MWWFLCLYVRILTAFLIIKLTQSVDTTHLIDDKTPLWSWECVNERCVPLKPTGTSKFQSLITCNMLCGSMKFWPQPTGEVSVSTSAVPVRAELFQLKILTVPSLSVREHLQDAFDLMVTDLHNQELQSNDFKEWYSVIVRVAVNGSGDPRMRLDTDESYSLILQPNDDVRGDTFLTADVYAQSFCGARHALETLSQLVWADGYARSLVAVRAARVADAPRFRYRGLLLDTARNYFPVGELLRTVDAMGAVKLNTFHWHASDSQAFPLRLSGLPQLARHGAYGPGAEYSPEEVRAVVRRARLRGVRVLLELDAPAHVGRAWSWGPAAGLGDLAHCVEAEPWTAYCGEPPCGQLNPRNPHVYHLLERLYADVLQLTGVTDLFHLGGDEVSEHCWQQHFNDTDALNLWMRFTVSALECLKRTTHKLPALILIWSSQFNDHIKQSLRSYIGNIGLQTRKSSWTQKYVTGVRTVISHEDVWDLNTGLGSWSDGSGGGSVSYNSWQRIYEHRPWARTLPLVVEGGEATVWSAILSSGELDAQIWPRAAALAERLWSDRTEGATRYVHTRLDIQRARFIARGVDAAPIWSMWCTQHPYSCS